MFLVLQLKDVTHDTMGDISVLTRLERIWGFDLRWLVNATAAMLRLNHNCNVKISWCQFVQPKDLNTLKLTECIISVISAILFAIQDLGYAGDLHCSQWFLDSMASYVRNKLVDFTGYKVWNTVVTANVNLKYLLCLSFVKAFRVYLVNVSSFWIANFRKSCRQLINHSGAALLIVLMRIGLLFVKFHNRKIVEECCLVLKWNRVSTFFPEMYKIYFCMVFWKLLLRWRIFASQGSCVWLKNVQSAKLGGNFRGSALGHCAWREDNAMQKENKNLIKWIPQRCTGQCCWHGCESWGKRTTTN